jgi:hypothetical protein
MEGNSMADDIRELRNDIRELRDKVLALTSDVVSLKAKYRLAEMEERLNALLQVADTDRAADAKPPEITH